MRISRRDLLKGAGAAAATLTLLPDPALAHDEEMDDEGHEGAESESQRVRRWVMVIDLRACDGCAGLGVPPQCTQGCNWARFVPEGQQWIEVYELEQGHLEGIGSHFMPAPCMQCQNAPCVNVCPVGATFHAPEGTVLIDQERCIGCRLCMAACPYDRRFFNWGEPVQPPQVRSAPYDVLTQVPAIEGTVMKCDFCTDRMSAGGLPTCVEMCPRGAIYVGDLEEGIATNGRRMASMESLMSENGVGRYKEELGTEPRVYYIPGHGQDASTDGEASEAFAGWESPGGGLMKDRLEWPWRRITDELAKLEAIPAASEAAMGDG